MSNDTLSFLIFGITVSCQSVCVTQGLWIICIPECYTKCSIIVYYYNTKGLSSPYFRLSSSINVSYPRDLSHSCERNLNGRGSVDTVTVLCNNISISSLRRGTGMFLSTINCLSLSCSPVLIA